MSPLKIGFLVDQLELSSYNYSVIEHVANSDHFAAPIIIHSTAEGLASPQDQRDRIVDSERAGFGGKLNFHLFSLLERVIKKVELGPVRRGSPDYAKRMDVAAITNSTLLPVAGNYSTSDLLLSFSTQDVKKIEDQGLDCIVYCGSARLGDDLLGVTKLGVLRLYLSDDRIYRDGPSGFWEVFNGDPSSGFVIQKLNAGRDNADVLLRGNIMSWNTWTANHAALLGKSAFFLKKVLDDIANSGELPAHEGPVFFDGRRKELTHALTLAKYLCRVLLPVVLSKLVEKFLSPKVGRWSLAYAKQDNFRKALGEYKEIENPKARFLADPFIYEHEGRQVVFAEDLFYSDNKGRISAVEVDGESEKFLGVVLEEDFHLSYPFIFEEGGTVYMMPETNEAYEIRLYESVDFPTKWKLKEVLMENVSAADTMLFKEGDTWFMLTNICSANVGDHKSELHIFYSNDLHSKNWNPIACGNPVIFDSSSARNGGFFRYENKLYRINQIHGKNHYGKAFGVNRIDQLDTENYRETRIKTIDASMKEGGVSSHHFNANGDFAVFDFARENRIKRMLKER